MGENHFSAVPMAIYGFILLMAAISYYILQSRIVKNEGKDSILYKAIGKDVKGKMSPILYILAIILSCVSSWISGGIYILVALIWLIPDKRIERVINEG
jgi:uncharacterized membrane protein